MKWNKLLRDILYISLFEREKKLKIKRVVILFYSLICNMSKIRMNSFSSLIEEKLYFSSYLVKTQQWYSSPSLIPTSKECGFDPQLI